MSIIAFMLLLATAPAAPDAQTTPSGTTHEQHQAEMKHRADMAMGFDQAKATHHFRILKDGGAIDVTANDAADTTTLTEVRTHLSHIAHAFANGDFSAPMETHAELPPGAKTMTELKRAMAYRYQEIPSGGRVRIITSDHRALDAVHEFLRYQIREHKTGDPLQPSDK